MEIHHNGLHITLVPNHPLTNKIWDLLANWWSAPPSLIQAVSVPHGQPVAEAMIARNETPHTLHTGHPAQEMDGAEYLWSHLTPAQKRLVITLRGGTLKQSNLEKALELNSRRLRALTGALAKRCNGQKLHYPLVRKGYKRENRTFSLSYSMSKFLAAHPRLTVDY